MARKTYGKIARSIPLTGGLAQKLARVAEVGYDIDETLERRRDPMVRVLASAPSGDEPSTADEDAVAAEAFAGYQRGEGVSSDQLRAELDLGA
ncbi:MAG: hypothetical protein JSS68_04470 [Actinobacteria bacterium]|nr:hypothetical protein [Actinomycetota bacterium]